MRTITFASRGAYHNTGFSETVHFEDDASDDEIDEELIQWLCENAEPSWYEEK